MRYLWIWLRVWFHTKLTMRSIRQIYSRMCALDYDYDEEIEVPNGKLVACGSTLRFTHLDGNRLYMNESAECGMIAQHGDVELFREKPSIWRNQVVKKPFMKSIGWAKELIQLNSYLESSGTYSRREKENVEKEDFE